ncbi:MAG: glutathione S-transferase N-terminal domain-containing protein [Deltaproteobacteria bacterium]|nr:glutathione S-transferase N-terminal domain-containing protein [Deltaproteobacteria bacterium]
MSLLTLYVDGYFVNQFDASVMVALHEKGLEFSTARGLLRGEGGVPASLTARTGIPRVPALQHRDLWLTESMAIIEYLEETFPAPGHPRVLPADPALRARARQIMSFVRFDVIDLRSERSFWMCVYPPPAPQPPLSRSAERDTRELLALAERFAGEQLPFCMAHADLAYTLLRLERTGSALPAPVAAFVAETIARPSVRAYLVHPRPPFPPPRQIAAG